MTIRKVLHALSTPLTLLILFAILAGGVYWGYRTITARVAVTRPACSTVAATVLTTDRVTVNVFNSGSIAGLAGRVSEVLGKGGFVIGAVGNTNEKVGSLLIVGATTDSPEVQLVAGWFASPAIQSDGRADHSVDVLVGNGYDETKALAANPPTSLRVPGGQVCLPTINPTPTPTKSPTPTKTPTPTGTPTPTSTPS